MSIKKIQIEFGQRLKFARDHLGHNQKQMAIALGIAVSTYQHYERGEREAPISLIPKITAYGFSSDWLLTGKGTPYITEERAGTASGKVTDIDQAHCDLVARFKNKTAAREANMDLLKLERVSPTKFEKACGYIKGLADGLEEPDQNAKKNHAG